jgi:hypothetical protein
MPGLFPHPKPMPNNSAEHNIINDIANEVFGRLPINLYHLATAALVLMMIYLVQLNWENQRVRGLNGLPRRVTGRGSFF